MSDELPPMPTGWSFAGLDHKLYTADQVRAYTRAARAAVWREAAEVAAPERIPFSDDEWRVRCEMADEFRARAEKEQGNG